MVRKEMGDSVIEHVEKDKLKKYLMRNIKTT
jgi:hypothetical protein